MYIFADKLTNNNKTCNMFSKETYIRRRQELKKLVGQGVIILFGNNEAPANYPANSYAPMRQDSTFLYYFGQHRDGLVGVIDIDNDEEMLFGDDIDVEDIVWMGYTPSVADLAAEVGITKTAPMESLTTHFYSPIAFECFPNRVRMLPQSRSNTSPMALWMNKKSGETHSLSLSAMGCVLGWVPSRVA